jgi:hypothetical protein
MRQKGGLGKMNTNQELNSGFRFFCTLCGQSLEAENEMAGSRIECPACHKAIEVPQIGARQPVESPEILPPEKPKRKMLVYRPKPTYHNSPAPSLPDQGLTLGSRGNQPIIVINNQTGAQTRREDSPSMVVAGYFLSFMLPFFGLIVGIVLMLRGKGGHGLLVVIISVITLSLFLYHSDVLLTTNGIW